MTKILEVEHSTAELDKYIIDHFNNLSFTLKHRVWRSWANYMRLKTFKDYRAGKSPSGDNFIPPKWQKRRMFLKLGKSSHLKTRGKGGYLQLGYFHTAGRIASVHHFGLRETFSKGILKGKTVKYPKRELLGITKDDLKELEKLILGALKP